MAGFSLVGQMLTFFAAVAAAIAFATFQVVVMLRDGTPPGWGFAVIVAGIAFGILLVANISLDDRGDWLEASVWGVASLGVTVGAALVGWLHEGWRLVAFELIALLPLAAFCMQIPGALELRARRRAEAAARGSQGQLPQ